MAFGRNKQEIPTAAQEREAQHEAQLANVNSPVTDERDLIAEGKSTPERSDKEIEAELKRGTEDYERAIEEAGLTEQELAAPENSDKAPAGIATPENRVTQRTAEQEHQNMVDRENLDADYYANYGKPSARVDGTKADVKSEEDFAG